MDELDAVVRAVSIPVQAVGGLSIRQAIECPSHGAPLVVLGAPLVIDADGFKPVTGDTLREALGEICREIKQPITQFTQFPIHPITQSPDAVLAVVHYALEPLAVELRDIAIPDIGDNDVLLRVGAVSVCGSDVHQAYNTHSWTVNVPVVLGHEFAGTVAQAGRSVKGVPRR